MNEITLNLARLKDHIAALEVQYNRPPGTITLLGVSKKQSAEKMRAAAEAGLHRFGESYLQEALEKIPLLAPYAPEWHFIGQLQANKTRRVAEQFAWVHSVSSLKLAMRLNTHRPENLPNLNICLQVNLYPGSDRAGIHEQDLLSVAEECMGFENLRLRGLMALPLPSKDVRVQRDAFRRLHACFNLLKGRGFPLDTLSAGTTHDYEAAIAEGSTLIRIGTVLFGPRE